MTWQSDPPQRAGGRWRTRRIIAACQCGGLLTDEESPPIDIVRLGEVLYACTTRGTRTLRPLSDFAGYEWKKEAHAD